MNAKCDDKDLGEATKKFDSSEFKANDTEVQLVNLHNVNVANFCNQIFEIKDALKENEAETIEEMEKVNEDHKGVKKEIENDTTIKPTDPQTTETTTTTTEAAQTTEANAGLDSGAAQTTVAVATIAFSMGMARLAL